MSTRALRRLMGDSDILVPELSAKLSDGETSSATEDLYSTVDLAPVKSSKRKKKKAASVNHFNTLNDEDAENQVCIENEVQEELPEEIEAQDEIEDDEEIKTTTNANQAPKNTGAKKKRKKKKKKKAKEITENGDLENENPLEEDEIDASIREVNRILGELPPSKVEETTSTQNVITDNKALLNVEHKHLIADNEMRRIFGSQVVQSERSNTNRRRHRVTHKKTWLTQQKDTWPPMTKTGLSMNLVETRADGQYFRFEHSHQYREVQQSFWDAVDSMNPENLTQVLHLQPYHIDTLLQISDVCRMSDDTAMATDLIERALYSFESSFHPCFNLVQGKCRLEYRIWENRSLFLALFKHLVYVGQKGCHRTALEFCKLLLSLDPDDDPLCVLLMIDFYAIKSQEYNFLIRMFHEWEVQKNLSQLPNFAMSVPLAMFHHANQEELDTWPADLMLQNSILMFPGVLMPLLDKCGINPDREVSIHKYFSVTSQISQPEALKQLIAVYIGRCYACWKEPEVVSWLERNVREVIKRVNEKDPTVEEYAKKRDARYKGTPRNIFRHIILSEIKDATAALPPELAHTAVMSYDPLPPVDSTHSYTRRERRTRVQQPSNLLSSFFQSLLPNYNPQEIVDEVQGAAGGAAEGTDLRQGIGQLMDAMRDLLNNIQPAAAPREDGQGQDEEAEPPEEFD